MLFILSKTWSGATYWTGKTTVNHISDKGLVSKIYERTNVNQEQKTNPIIKQAEDLNRHLWKKTHTHCQQLHEKTLYIINHQGNTNQNHKKVSPHTC